MSQAQSLEALRERDKPQPALVIAEDTALRLITALESIQAIDLKITELQSQLDELPAKETAISEDRTKTPAEVRAGVAALKDNASDLKVEQKRLGEDKAKTVSDAARLFPQGRMIVSNYFSRLYENEKQKALTALAPFFVGATAVAEPVLEYLPSVKLAATHAANCHYRVTGGNPEETLAMLAHVITEFGLHKTQAE